MGGGGRRGEEEQPQTPPPPPPPPTTPYSVAVIGVIAEGKTLLFNVGAMAVRDSRGFLAFSVQVVQQSPISLNGLHERITNGNSFEIGSLQFSEVFSGFKTTNVTNANLNFDLTGDTGGDFGFCVAATFAVNGFAKHFPEVGIACGFRICRSRGEQVAGQSQFGVVVYVAATLASMDLGTPLKSGVQNLTINSPVLIAAYGSLVGSGAVNVQDAAVGEYMADALTQITNLNPSGCIAFVSGFSLKTSYDTGSADSKFRQFVDKLDSFGGGIRDIANMVKSPDNAFSVKLMVVLGFGGAVTSTIDISNLPVQVGSFQIANIQFSMTVTVDAPPAVTFGMLVATRFSVRGQGLLAVGAMSLSQSVGVTTLSATLQLAAEQLPDSEEVDSSLVPGQSLWVNPTGRNAKISIILPITFGLGIGITNTVPPAPFISSFMGSFGMRIGNAAGDNGAVTFIAAWAFDLVTTKAAMLATITNFHPGNFIRALQSCNEGLGCWSSKTISLVNKIFSVDYLYLSINPEPTDAYVGTSLSAIVIPSGIALQVQGLRLADLFTISAANFIISEAGIYASIIFAPIRIGKYISLTAFSTPPELGWDRPDASVLGVDTVLDSDLASPEVCFAMCGNTTGCLAWVYWSGGGICSLKSSLGTQAACTGCTSGVLSAGMLEFPPIVRPDPVVGGISASSAVGQFSPTLVCAYQEAADTGNDISTVSCPPNFYPDNAVFVSLGSATGSCGAFDLGACHQPSSLNVNCSSDAPWTISKGIYFPGWGATTQPTVSTEFACGLACAGTQNCKAWHFNGVGGAGSCTITTTDWLSLTLGSTDGLPAAGAGYSLGTRNPNAPFLSYIGYSMAGALVSGTVSASVESVSVCYARCAGVSGCIAFVMSSQGNCSLMSSVVSFTATSGARVGIMNEDRLYTAYGTQLSGTQLGSTVALASNQVCDDCVSMCTSNSSCAAFQCTYCVAPCSVSPAPASTCKLFTSVASQSLDTSSAYNFISGFVRAPRSNRTCQISKLLAFGYSPLKTSMDFCAVTDAPTGTSATLSPNLAAAFMCRPMPSSTRPAADSTICDQADEDDAMQLSCPSGSIMEDVVDAAYGYLPTNSLCSDTSSLLLLGRGSTKTRSTAGKSWFAAQSFMSDVTNACVGSRHCSIAASANMATLGTFTFGEDVVYLRNSTVGNASPVITDYTSCRNACNALTPPNMSITEYPRGYTWTQDILSSNDYSETLSTTACTCACYTRPGELSSSQPAGKRSYSGYLSTALISGYDGGVVRGLGRQGWKIGEGGGVPAARHQISFHPLSLPFPEPQTMAGLPDVLGCFRL